MKVSIKHYSICSILFLSALFFSCESTSLNKSKSDNQITIDNTDTVTTEESLNSDNKSESTEDLEEVVIVEEFIPEPTPVEIFVKSLEGIKLEIVEAPTKWINYGKSFNSPYTVLVTDADGNPVSDFDLRISYPEKRQEGKLWVTTTDVKTNEEGKYSFVPPSTKFAADSKVAFFPSPKWLEDNYSGFGLDEEAIKIEEAVLEEKLVSADYWVRSDVVYKGALLFIWDFNEKNKPLNNSYEILAQFRNRGMTLVGNAPTSDESYIGKSLTYLYKENYEIVQDNYGYLICGTVKFVKNVEKVPDSDEYLCSLVSQISAVSMKNGEKVFEQEFTQEATGANWNKAVSACKDQLSKKIVDALLYGL